MNPLQFIPKENPQIPDQYGVKIDYITGKLDEFEIVNHMTQDGIFKFMMKNETINWVPISSILKIEFDKRLNKILELKAKHDQGK